AISPSMPGSQDSARFCGTVHGDGTRDTRRTRTGLGNFDREGLGQLVAGVRLEPGESSRNTLIETDGRRRTRHVSCSQRAKERGRRSHEEREWVWRLAIEFVGTGSE